MPTKVLFDLSRIDQSRVALSIEEIRRINPHRFEFEQLDGVFELLPEERFILGYKDVRADEFWVRGHIPGMPLLPGVLMIEAAAQLCSIYQAKAFPTKGFFAFGGLDGVKFRAAVRLGDRLILIARAVQLHPRRSTFEAQGVVGEKLAFEATITGVALPEGKADPREA